MKEIKEILVVEGKDDTKKLKTYFLCETIETNGSAINKQTIEYIRRAHQTRGVIVFTDPDYPGEKIRTTITKEIPDVKHAFLYNQEKSKIGVEHATYSELNEALSNVVTFREKNAGLITYQVIMKLGIVGNSNLRNEVARRLKIGHVNNKQFIARANALDIKIEEINEVIHEINCQRN